MLTSAHSLSETGEQQAIINYLGNLPGSAPTFPRVFASEFRLSRLWVMLMSRSCKRQGIDWWYGHIFGIYCVKADLICFSFFQVIPI
jgi:hypothetical protein